MNNWCGVGNLTRDPETNVYGDKTKTSFSIAISKKIKDGEITTFIPVVVWGRAAEYCRDYLRKGLKVSVEGELRIDQYEKDGQKVKFAYISPIPFGVKIMTPKASKPEAVTPEVMPDKDQTNQVPF